MKCTNCGYEVEGGKFCPQCGTALGGFEGGEGNTPPIFGHAYERPKPVYPMKWYNFLKVALWFGIVSNFATGLMYFTGNQYEGVANEVYAKFPGLKGADILYGLGLLVIGALGIAAWYGLKNYKSNGPKFLVATYVANVVVSLLYTFALVSITGESSVTSTVPGIVVTIAFAVYNYKYFKEREDLFIY